MANGDFLLFQVLRDLQNLGITFIHVMANRSTLKVNYNGINSLETWTQQDGCDVLTAGVRLGQPGGRDCKKATDLSEQPLLGQILTPHLHLPHKYPFLYF